MRLMTKDLTEAYTEIEKKFSKAKQIAPSIIIVSNVPESSTYQHFVEKIIHEANSINKRSMVFVVLLHDNNAETADKYLGYKKFGKAIQLKTPDEEVVTMLCDKYNIPEQERASFEEKPIGQLITMLNEYSINNMA